MSTDQQQAGSLTQQAILDKVMQQSAALRQLGVRSLGLFGSHARGTAHGESDVDFLVVMQRPSFRDYMAVKGTLESLLGRRVDLVLEESLKSRLREHVLAEVAYVPGLSPVP